jgi:UDP-glucose 4-epimerase
LGVQYSDLAPIDSRIVILGASGFLGSELVHHFKMLGCDVVPLSTADIDLAREDSVDPLSQLLNEDDIVIIASMVTPDRSNDEQTMLTNILMGRHLCEALKAVVCRYVVYISSDAVYGHDEGVIEKDTACSPYDLYGLAHFLRERMLGEIVGSKTKVFIVRPCAIYGGGDSHNSYGPNRFLRSATEGGVIAVIGNGEELRDHIYIDDFCRYVATSIRHCMNGIANLATGSAVSFYEIAERVAAIVDRPVQIENLRRTRQIVHRCFSRTPDFEFTSLDAGLRAMRDGLGENQRIK